jgi:hypothetical protein
MTDRHELNTGCRTLVFVALLSSLVAATGRRAAAEDPTSIEDFNAQSKDWSRLKGTRLKLEGRCAGMSNNRLLMTRCDLVFEFGDGVEAPRTRPQNVVITGHLEEHGSRLVFVVTNLRSAPGDMEQLRLRRFDIDVNSPDEWYGLAGWARKRAAFYEDEDLDAQATELNRQGVNAEYRRLPADESTGLVALAEKTGRLGLSGRLRMEYLHEAISREFEVAQSNERPGFDTVMAHALKWLPGARTPLVEYNEAVKQTQAAYLKDRIKTYDAAEDDERPVLERLLYIQAALGKIERDAATDGRNGFEIASRIEASIPELDGFPEEYRQREIQWQTEHVTELTREELLVLVDRLEDRNQEGQGLEVRRRWLEARAERLNQAGVSGRLELAEEYVDLVGDEEAAVDIYRELYHSPEGQKIAASRLQDLGYTFDGQKWRSGPLPEQADDLSMAIRNGSVRAGMTQADVRAVLGRPETTLRFASRGQVVELWVYPGPGVSIHFARHHSDEEPTAIDVFNLPARTREQLRQ